MSLYSQISNLPPSTLTLGAGLTCSSYLFLFNFADYQRGVLPAILGRFGPTYMTPQAKVRAFSGYFKSAMTGAIGSAVANSILMFSTAYLSTSPLITTLAITSGTASGLMLPATFILGIPKIFNELLDLDKRDALRGVSADSTEAKRVDALIAEWERKHLIRFAFYSVAWGAGLAALMLDGRA